MRNNYPPCRLCCDSVAAPLNAEKDGTCRTIKAVSYKTSLANFLHTNDWGATGAIMIYEQ